MYTSTLTCNNKKAALTYNKTLLTYIYIYISLCYNLSAVSQVTLLDPFHGSLVGTLHVTNYKVFFREEAEDSEVL